ncbi:HAD family hydrolase [Stratiformator vulcanicus]|uniref:Phosphoglycolate phosphatase n=1 Tax=Stratiformator vulcanicus TaxID=2527980 RepID=A0A517R539_9PLAN|nr:HAD family hydrolase [Stratiformator vulcanicus]QDT39008.1 phosphoglycolate phosphatase [Stratiformator vulcanicus]
MRLRVIATDYDGTIAIDGVLNPSVREAIGNARKSGVLVVIVTGRILSELRDVAGCLDFVDGVVAENGAVVAFPNGHVTVLGAGPPLALITKLTERGIDFKVGRCVVEMDAEFADVAISLIREMQLPLAITFNRGRMMLLPPSISKSGGLRQLLDTLNVSVHNAIGIGDAENDHELLSCCDHGVAVSWGSARLKESADFVLEGDGVEAVADYIAGVSTEIRLPRAASIHHKVVLEEVGGQPPFEVSIRGRNVLVAGDTKSGKSWLAGLLIEQQILKTYTVCVFDPEGDYSSLASLPNTVSLGGGHMLPHDNDLKILLQQRLSVVLDLSHLEHHQKREYICHHLPLVANHRRNYGYPHRIVLDECHYFLRSPRDNELLDFQLDGYTLVTYHPSELPAAILNSVEVVAATRLTESAEVDVLRDLFDAKSDEYIDSHDWYEQLANLGINESALLPPTDEAEGRLRRFIVAPRLTDHVRHRSKYFDMPVAKEHEFVFTTNGQAFGESAATLRELTMAAKRVTADVLSNHSRHHDFSRWIINLFCDRELANNVRKIESTMNLDGDVDRFLTELRDAVQQRYESD